MGILISGTTNDIIINGASVATDAEVTNAVAPLATTAYVDGKMVLGTAVTASGTAIDFTGIPSWVKRITVMFNGVSTSGASQIQVQLGTTSGIETTGYIGRAVSLQSAATVAVTDSTRGLSISTNSTESWNGQAVFNLIGTNKFIGSFNGVTMSSLFAALGSTSKTLSGTLDRIRITTVNGTDVFDAGSINIMYEG